MDYYFDSYSHFGIHEEMLKDQVRTSAYQRAIIRNRDLFEGKVVLDIGCGTGILCMFAASAGAKLVIGVDMSGMIERAREIVKANNFEDKIVLLRGKMEEVELPVPKVDIIISEWMGYFLLYESMLDTVLWARDRYLVAEGGRILPDQATMFLTAIEDAEYRHEKIGFWEDVYGFDMSCIQQDVLREPLVDVVEGKSVVCKPFPFFAIDIYSVRKEDLAFSLPFNMQVLRQDTIHAFLGYFDILFQAPKNEVHFSTGPHCKPTHWKQTVFYLEQALQVEAGDVVNGKITVQPNSENHRELDIEIEYWVNECSGEEERFRQTFHMC